MLYTRVPLLIPNRTVPLHWYHTEQYHYTDTTQNSTTTLIPHRTVPLHWYHTEQYHYTDTTQNSTTTLIPHRTVPLHWYHTQKYHYTDTTQNSTTTLIPHRTVPLHWYHTQSTTTLIPHTYRSAAGISVVHIANATVSVYESWLYNYVCALCAGRRRGMILPILGVSSHTTHWSAIPNLTHPPKLAPWGQICLLL